MTESFVNKDSMDGKICLQQKSWVILLAGRINVKNFEGKTNDLYLSRRWELFEYHNYHLILRLSKEKAKIWSKKEPKFSQKVPKFQTNSEIKN